RRYLLVCLLTACTVVVTIDVYSNAPQTQTVSFSFVYVDPADPLIFSSVIDIPPGPPVYGSLGSGVSHILSFDCCAVMMSISFNRQRHQPPLQVPPRIQQRRLPYLRLQLYL